METLKRTFILVILICGLAIGNLLAQSHKDSKTKNSNFEKQTFSTRTGSTGTDRQAGPPGPGGGGGGGNPIPISPGLGLLILGSLAFWGNKIYKEIDIDKN